jgi:hypothetical protein
MTICSCSERASRRMRNGPWGGQPGATLRDVSVGNWVLWPQAGPIQDHLNWVKIHRDDRRRRPAPVLILWAAWGSNPEPKGLSLPAVTPAYPADLVTAGARRRRAPTAPCRTALNSGVSDRQRGRSK